MHENFSREEALDYSSDRSFGFVFTVVFVVIALWPLLNDAPIRDWSIGLAIATLAISLIRPQLLAPFNNLWAKFGNVLHRIVNPVILGGIFFVVVTPTALILRLAGKDPLNRKVDKSVKSYWIKREPPGPSPESMPKQY